MISLLVVIKDLTTLKLSQQRLLEIFPQQLARPHVRKMCYISSCAVSSLVCADCPIVPDKAEGYGTRHSTYLFRCVDAQICISVH